MKRKIKNFTMGYLPVEIDRSIFQKRIEMISGLHPLAQAIVLDYEKYFKGDDTIGYSYSSMLKKSLDAHKTKLGDKSVTAPIQAGFDTSMLKTAIKYQARQAYTPTTFFKTSWDCDSIMFFDLLNGFFAIPNKLTDPYVIYSLTDITLPTVKLFDPAITTNPYTYYSRAEGNPYFGPTLWWQDQMIVGWGVYANGKNQIISDQASRTIKAMMSINQLIVQTRNKNTSTGALTYTTSNYYNVTSLSVAEVIAVIDSAITVIQWLESENNAVEIRGNVDGVKIDGYEKILADQLNYLNTMTDVVQSSLINEKIEHQAKKDATLALIEQKKAELELVKQAKRNSIATMTDFSNNYQTLLQSKKDEIIRGLIQ
jgi:hypothetical protein